MLSPDDMRQAVERLRGHRGTYSLSPEGLADRIEAHGEAVASNLARLEDLRPGDTITFSETSGFMVEGADEHCAEGIWFDEDTLARSGRIIPDALKAMVRGGATVELAADRSDVEGVGE